MESVFGTDSMSAAAQPFQRSLAGPRSRPAALEPSVVAIGRGTLIGAGAVLCLLAAWASGATWYLVSRDEIVARFLAKQTEMQYAYEDRIGALRTHLDRVASQKLLEQDGLEGRISDLMTRQVQLETRQAVLTTLAERAGAPAAIASLREPESRIPASSLPRGASAYAPAPKPASTPDTLGLRLRGATPTESSRPQRTSELEFFKSPMNERLAGIDRSMSLVETAQLRTLDGFVRAAQAKVTRIRTAVIEAGLNPDRLEAGAPEPMGGPLVRLPPGAKSGPFETLAAHASASLAHLDRLRRSTAALPFGRPMVGDPDLTSGFGARIDPFTRSPALHTGLDFRADHGAPVRAAGAGRVIGAEYAGGYGNMVEVDHGNGVTTRYAHLSAIAVGVGQTVAAGTVLGRAGSTGRSTGAHLHYETRINDEPVDPQRFLRAGLKIAEAVESAPR